MRQPMDEVVPRIWLCGVRNWLTTDAVTKVIFTTSWDLLTSTANRCVTETFKTVVRQTGVVHNWPHLAYHEVTALLCLPHLAWSLVALENYSVAVMSSSKAERVKKYSTKDVFGYFSNVKDPDTGELILRPQDVRRNAANFIIAGSDTTASSVAATFFYLSHDPTAYAKVAQEVRSAFESASTIKAGPILNNCVCLRAAINEALRMAPAAPQPLWREAEAGGCVVDGDLIQASLNVGAGIFSLQHNVDAFPDPYKYDIERWIIDPRKGEVKEKERIKEMSRSWAPFFVGSR
ncbi:uncharacterized protein PAC_06620 [Phialocephala subalpina]|uniref:Benzoate 4-monooxygenase cytochrome P450 n=1 Tax=Phialocephala subalpina TaxID=576137 RepID=A0A1L7WVD7_9HELO|nr:uncharacterized protein PAC_06620 [Phialocephala subalpina]